MDCSLPSSSVHGILQERILEWVAISFSKASSQSRNQTQVSCIAGRLFTNWAMLPVHFSGTSKILAVCCMLHHSVVSNSLRPHGLYVTYQAPLSMMILQERILEWVAMPSSRGSSQPRDRTQVPGMAFHANSLPSEPPGKSKDFGKWLQIIS